MDASRQAELASSHEALLRGQARSRSSTESAYRSSSEFDLDELTNADDDAGYSPRLRGGWSPSKKKLDKGKEKEGPRPLRLDRVRGLLRQTWCWVPFSLLLAATLIIVASNGWMIRRRPSPYELSPPWYPTPLGGTDPTWDKSYKSAAKIVKDMSLTEKVNVTTGTGWAMDLCVGNTGFAHNFPSLCLQDGPLGIRFADNSTYWPAGITAAATWNKTMMYKRGRALGLEHRLKGVNIMLGPCMGPLGKMPAGGRNWEGFGPDPVLAGIASAQTIKGVQREGVMATAKHYVANEQEHYRQAWEWDTPHAISSNIDDRTLHEVYLWPFSDSIRAGVASVMCSYNKVNNSYACDNSKLLNGILKDELGFQGFVQSDWLAQRSGVASALAGLDMSMPGDGEKWQDGDSFWGHKLTEAVLNGSVPVERLDDMVTRVVAAWYKLGQDNKDRWPAPPPEGEGGPNFSSWTPDEVGKLHQAAQNDNTTAVVNKYVDAMGANGGSHRALAQEIAAEGIVLVKNEGNVLPLNRDDWSDGDTEKTKFQVGIYGEDAGTEPERDPNACDDRACNEGTLATGWGSGSVVFPFLTTPINALRRLFDHRAVLLDVQLANHLPKNYKATLAAQDLCMVFANSDAGEGYIPWNGITDRKDLNLQKGGDSLIKKVVEHCSKTIVIIHAVGPVVVRSWIDHPNVKAVLLAHLPGEESGNALVDVLTGENDASGRLPYTIGKSLKDYGPGGQIMYKAKGKSPQQDFEEGLMIDYRYFDDNDIEPEFEFGFGLSYTTFNFSSLLVQTIKDKEQLGSPRPNHPMPPPTYPTERPSKEGTFFPPDFRKLKGYIYPFLEPTQTIGNGEYPYPSGYNTVQEPSPAGGGEGGNPSLYDMHLAATVNVTNTGTRTGQQVVQLYLSFPETFDNFTSANPPVVFPRRVLRAFEKIELKPAESRQLVFKLTRKDLSFWSVFAQNWVMPVEGNFTVSVGASSRDLPLSGVW